MSGWINDEFTVYSYIKGAVSDYNPIYFLSNSHDKIGPHGSFVLVSRPVDGPWMHNNRDDWSDVFGSF